MSSPLAKPKKGVLDSALIRVHRRLSHGERIRRLAKELGDCMAVHDAKPSTGVDVGCGDFSLAAALKERRGDSRWIGLDLYPKPQEAEQTDRWRDYVQFDGRRIPYADRSFGMALMCDMLHHAAPDDRISLLREALRTAEHVYVKDHLEYGFFSRTCLRLMDFVGNYGYGVSVPDRYFTEQSFRALADAAGGRILSLRVGIDLYAHSAWLRRILQPKWQFIAVLTRQD